MGRTMALKMVRFGNLSEMRGKRHPAYTDTKYSNQKNQQGLVHQAVPSFRRNF
jgi:hypothetical protein